MHRNRRRQPLPDNPTRSEHPLIWIKASGRYVSEDTSRYPTESWARWSGGVAVNLTIPLSLSDEHDELRSELQLAMRVDGPVGEAARAVASELSLHFAKEDEHVLAPLGLLAEVAQGKVTPEMVAAIAMADSLKAAFPEMRAEHKRIRTSLERLRRTADQEGRPRIAAFAERVMRHARTEEEVLYPAAILLGEYLRGRLTPEPRNSGPGGGHTA